ncbi:MAG: protein-L-isoaspartate(D-aspartate) O-methyltransferase [Bacteroidales bacterium]|nr:protein-L-isoaspartate(D-aspartate) O-methyltransferase [Bacteroidales bacterium]
MAENKTQATAKSVPVFLDSIAAPVIILLFFLMWGSAVYSQDTQQQTGSHPAFSERTGERERMVRDHIENYPYHPVKDQKVLTAMRRVPRHRFVPAEYQDLAYRNSPLSIGHSQTISQPVIVAHMTELLDIQPDDRILEIGTGSGYQAAVLGELCKHVFTMEIVAPLGRKAEKLLDELGYESVKVRIGNGYQGWPEEAPFDKIIVTCAPNQIPQPLLDQMAPGGRMVIPVGGQFQTQYMVEVTKNQKGRISKKEHYPVRFVPMTGKKRE